MQDRCQALPEDPAGSRADFASGEARAAYEPSPDEIRRASDLLKVVGDLTRMRILCALLRGELSVSDLQQSLDMSQSAVSHQLRSLRDANLVKYRREWKTVYYSLADDHVLDLITLVVEHIRHD
ncbi:ArsR/SmtB family transcription factor [Rubrobacter aplysinae]|uniref:ArsR/SmtB family transcription factor n=1 Tax=Rubrobacter aplysinae TaxID=909625 RepID=UPI000A05A4C2|nr:metalloregulator ArsR/SmtB family transcription factor [Rubrobacter aplysinae]